MTPEQRNSRIRSSHGEVPFEFDEILYSRTDLRGVIQTGNAAFCNVSNFAWGQLQDAPHRIIRHPDMPKGVFHLVWDRIKAGKPTGAYLQNKTEDGLSYWVYAILIPVEGGYVSVRIKPSSALFQTIVKDYAALLETEAGDAGPDRSSEMLLERLTDHGFSDYDSFMSAALAAELSSPMREKVTILDPRLAKIEAIHATLKEVLAEKHNLLKGFDEIRDIPMNLHITASRIESYGGPVATLAENYRLMAADITQVLSSIVNNGKTGPGLGERMIVSASSAIFRVGAVQVQGELLAACRSGKSELHGGDSKVEVGLLAALTACTAREAAEDLNMVSRSSAKLVSVCEELRRLMLGLDSIRVLCRVEAGRMQSNRSTLQSIIDQLERFHSAIDGRLDRINDLAAGICDAAAKAAEDTTSLAA